MSIMEVVQLSQNFRKLSPGIVTGHQKSSKIFTIKTKRVDKNDQNEENYFYSKFQPDPKTRTVS